MMNLPMTVKPKLLSTVINKTNILSMTMLLRQAIKC